MPDLHNLRIESERLLLVPVSMEYKEDIFREFQEPVTRFMEPKAPVTFKKPSGSSSSRSMSVAQVQTCNS